MQYYHVFTGSKRLTSLQFLVEPVIHLCDKVTVLKFFSPPIKKKTVVIFDSLVVDAHLNLKYNLFSAQKI